MLLKKPGYISAIIVKLRDPDRAPELAAHIERLFGHRSRSWQEREKGNLQIFSTLRLSAGITVSLIILLAGFLIFNTLTMAVVEKIREIAILRSMGYRRSDISLIFLGQGFLVASIGSVLGAGAGRALHLPGLAHPDQGDGVLLHRPISRRMELAALYRRNVDRVRGGARGEFSAGAPRGQPPAGGHVARLGPMTPPRKGPTMDNPVPSMTCHALEKYLGEEEARVHVLRGVSLTLNQAKSMPW